jgi:AcrR family transcriptional regulator
MVKNAPPTGKGAQTRDLILSTALELFRDRTFDNTTMQDIAEAAGVAKSAAYYYFPSKESIVAAYYEKVQVQQEELCAAFFATNHKLKDRLTVAMNSKFDLTANDRQLLGIIFRYNGEPAHPLSCLGPSTQHLRHRAMRVFVDALSVESLPRDLAELLPLSLWALQMGLTVLFLYDTTRNQQRTRTLAAGCIEFTLRMLTLAKLPILKPVRNKVMSLLREADLLPQLT